MDLQWQKKLFEEYYGPLLKIAFRYLNTYEQAAEATHQGFLKIFHELARLRINQNEKFKANLWVWIKRVFIISLVHHVKSELKLQIQRPIPDDIWKQGDKAPFDVDLKYVELIKILKGLPASYRLAFNLYVIDGFSHAEIAKLFAITKTESKENLNKARKCLNCAYRKASH